ncbi:thermonuclease family protein (plasmid) [Clostridium baratii]
MLNKNIRKIISSGLIITSILATTLLNGCDTKNLLNKNVSSEKVEDNGDIISSSSGFELKSYSEQPPNTKEEVVERVVDGDTIVVKGGEKGKKIRFLLVDTPETKKPKTPVQPFGKKACDFTKNALKKGDKIYVQYGKSKSDKYGRYLGYIYYKKDGNWIMLNEELVSEGLARVGYVYEDKEHLEELNKAQEYAQDNQLNIWSKPGYVTNKGYNPEVFK